MSRYAMKFSKEGPIRYISHLDLLRLFKRSFKRAGVRLQYSHGFNPHPKMSFAQPLSLGYASTGEYLEFDAAETYTADEIMKKLNSVLPEGIVILSCRELDPAVKSLAALTEYAGYEIRIPALYDPCDMEGDDRKTMEDTVKEYLSQDRIVIRKHQKKSGKDAEVDIRPLIAELNGYVDNNYIMITMKLSAGSTANLNPEPVLATFCEYAGIQYDRAEVFIKRTDIFFYN